jgi:hypothetical protein
MNSQRVLVNVPPAVAPPRGAAWAADLVLWLARTRQAQPLIAHPAVHAAALAAGGGASASAAAAGGWACAAVGRLARHPAVHATRAWVVRIGHAVWRGLEAIGESRARPVLREIAAREAMRRRMSEERDLKARRALPAPPPAAERTTTVLAAPESASMPRDGAADGTVSRLDPVPGR